jgi:DNA uptake protein ComE-like DNA-binding protein
MHECELRCLSISALVLALAILTACTQKETPQQIQQQTAQATAEAKSDAKAIAQGLREGWNRDRPLDLNAASKDQLVSLPGVSEGEADRIIAGRPYRDPGELVTRHIMPKAEYDKMSDRAVARQ